MTVQISSRSIANDSRAVVFEWTGNLAESDAAALHRALNEQVRHGVLRFVIDVGGLTVASEGDFPPAVAALMVSLATALQKHGGGLAVTRPPALLDQILRILRFDRILAICPDEVAALAALARKG